MSHPTTEKTGRALDIAVRRATSDGPKRGEDSVQGPRPRIKRPAPDENLPHRRRPWTRGRRKGFRADERLARPPRTSAPWMVPAHRPAQHLRLWQRGMEREVTESDWCCHSGPRPLGKCAPRARRMRGHSAMPNRLTRSRSVATSVCKEPFATGLSDMKLRSAPLVHA